MKERPRLAIAVIGAISVFLVAIGAVAYAQVAMHSSTGWGMMRNMMGNPGSMQAQCQAMMDQTDMTQCRAMMSSNDMSPCANMIGSYQIEQHHASMQQYNRKHSC